MLWFAEGDAPASEVVGGDLDAYGVAGDDADVVAAHFARQVGEDDMSVAYLDAECGVWERLAHDTD